MAATAPRQPLTRDRALREAVALADAEGLEAVSMRHLAARLDVVPMALYKHVANKDDLLGGMIDTLIDMYDPPGGTDWRQAVRGRILSARRVLLAHPWARRAIESRTTRTPTVLAYMDSLSGEFLAGGFSADLTHHVMHALGHRIWGFSPEAFDDPDALALPDDAAGQQAMIGEVRRRYPSIVAMFEASGGHCDEQYEFEFTLDLLLAAFGRLHETGWQSARAGLPT